VRPFINGSHPIEDADFAAECRAQLEEDGALVLQGFFTAEAIALAAQESSDLEAGAFYSNATHNVYLTAADPSLPEDHPYNRKVISNKGLIADDLIAVDSPIREIYQDPSLRSFLQAVLDIESVHPYSDKLSSIVISIAGDGMELGWHFDTSGSSVTMLLQSPEGGGVFEFVPNVRDADSGDMAFEAIDQVLDGNTSRRTLDFKPGDLVLFRGRNALHRVTPVEGNTTRSLVIFAFNERPDASMSEEALMTFFGRVA
jgi:hypothetical protein